jgi:hypothetical protein
VGDVISFRDGLFGSFAAVQAAASQVGGDVVIALNADNEILLKNVALASLHQNDFVFA